MKSALLVFSAALLAVSACANTAPTVDTGNGGSTASGGSTGSGGSVSTGGTTGTGGFSTGGVTGSGGSVSTGGITGSGGSVSTGGITGAGGSVSTGGTTGSGGSVSAGGTSGTTGGGGVAGHAGNTGTAGATGAAGAAGGGAGGGASIAAVVGSLDGALMLHDCAKASTDGYDCPNIGPCTNNQVTKTSTFPISGTTGQTYNMTFHVYGVVEPYNYVGGTRAAGDNTSVTTDPDLFQTGGMPQPANGNGYDYNTYEMDVYPAGSGMTPDTYFLNSVDLNENPHTNTTTTQHATFPISYMQTVKIYGGGMITFTTFDSNCVQVMNCGTKAQNTGNNCSSHFTVPLTGAMPQPPASFTQPYTSGSGEQYGQWVFIDVTSVVGS